MKEERLKVFYQQMSDRLAADTRRLRKRNTAFAVGELSTFVLAIAAVTAYVSTDTGYTYLYMAGLMLLAYVIIRQQDVANGLRIETLENTQSVYQKELAYLNGDFSGFSDGAQYINPNHHFTFDMDVFGRDSLFNRINRTITTGGSKRLAQQLQDLSCSDIAARQEAIRELSEREPLRTQFLAYGQKASINTTEILSALQGIKSEAISTRPSALYATLATIASVGVCLIISLAIAGIAPASLALLWVMLQFGIVFATNNADFLRATKAVNRMHKELRTYISLITTIVGSGLQSKESQTIIKALTEDSDALMAFKELERILDGLDRQGNPLYRFLSDAFFCYDYWLVRRFFRWQANSLHRVEDWIKAVSHFDALVSMATFRYNEPMAIDAEIVVSDDIVYEAEAITHPFLGAKAVSNDFILADGHYYIITGANMAGKSTFLRTIGINYILARCGLPVFARRMKVSVFSLFTSMRTTDDLTQGISYFNAELLRLQQLINFCQQHQPTLIILDEILKGTNSLDKLNGSRLFLEHIQHLPVTGIIATHDLELSKMADEHPSRFHNYCFEIELSDHVTYTYKITEGIARNQNATFLLKNLVLKEESPFTM